MHTVIAIVLGIFGFIAVAIVWGMISQLLKMGRRKAAEQLGFKTAVAEKQRREEANARFNADCARAGVHPYSRDALAAVENLRRGEAAVLDGRPLEERLQAIRDGYAAAKARGLVE